MSHPHGTGLRLWLLAIGLCVGCGELAPEEYGGERLFSLHGSAQLETDTPSTGLEVAIALIARDTRALRLLGSRTQGEFPNQFTLDLRDRPPEDSFITPEDHPEWGRVAVGLIAAAPPDHPEYVDLVTTAVSTIGALGECHVGGCTCAGDGCKRESSTCLSSDHTQCYTQSLLCPETTSTDDACRETHSTGDKAITGLPWSRLAGLSQNYIVVYLERAAPPGGYFATALNADAGLAAGYHLVEGEAVAAAPDSCDAYTFLPDRAADAFNQAHGTRLTVEQLRNENCDASSCKTGAVGEFEAYLEQATLDSGCRHPTTKLRAVSSDQPISVKLGKVLPLDFLNL